MDKELILKILTDISADLMLFDQTSSLDDWREIEKYVNQLLPLTTSASDPEVVYLIDNLKQIIKKLTDGSTVNIDKALKSIFAIIQALQSLENSSTLDETLRRQAIAESNHFLHNIAKEEEATSNAIVLDENEQSEVLAAIENRVYELDNELVNLQPNESDQEKVRSIFRQFHTLKGECAICGIKNISELCHSIESEISDARSGELILSKDIVDILQEFTGIIKSLLAGQDKEEIGLEFISSLLSSLKASVALSKSTIPAVENNNQQSKKLSQDEFPDFFSQLPSTNTNVDTTNLSTTPPSSSEVNMQITSSQPLNDTLNLEQNNSPDKKSKQTTIHIKKEIVDENLNQEEIDDSRNKSNKAMKTIPVGILHLEKLMELINEVSLQGSLISHQLQNTKFKKLEVQASNLIRACRRLQESANNLRMTSIKPLFLNIKRAAFETARISKKLINIDMTGAETQIDRAIIENLSAALIHVVRNAVDHGIEAAGVRSELGKPEKGLITLSAHRTDSDVIITLSDDGRGLDLDRILQKAIEFGKVKAGDKLSELDISNLIFLPGLSTAKEITKLSGRGVGMEIVKKSIDKLRGKVELITKKNMGTTLKMRFPVALSAIDGLVVMVGDNYLVLPVGIVKECFKVTSKQISTIEGKDTVVNIRGVIVPVLFLDKEFGFKTKIHRPEDGVLVLIENGNLLTALLVDETVSTQQVIIRPVDGIFSDSPLISGIAILPNNNIGLIVETNHLCERVSINASSAFSAASNKSNRNVETVSIGSNQVGMIDFTIFSPDSDGNICEHIFAINAFKTKSFIPTTNLQPLPNAPEGFAGILLSRGETIPVINLALALGLTSPTSRRSEWEQIILLCEFAGKTIGFLATKVNHVSYISWQDIMPPPASSGLIQFDYIVGTILVNKLKGTLKDSQYHDRVSQNTEKNDYKKSSTVSIFKHAGSRSTDVAFVLDFEKIVGNIFHLYNDIGLELNKLKVNTKHTTRLLLVEDSPVIRKQMFKALTNAGIDVIEATDGKEAWEKLLELNDLSAKNQESIFAYVDLVLCDIEMPLMDGYTLTHNIKQHPQLMLLPVILHSSITNSNMINRAKEVEADGFVSKCNPKELMDQLSKYL